MAVAGFLAGAAERHRLHHRHSVLDHRRLADHQTGGVVDHDALADARRRVNIHTEGHRDAVLQHQGEIAMLALPQPMRHSVRAQCVKALEIEQGSGEIPARRVAFVGGDDVAKASSKISRSSSAGVTSLLSLLAR